MEKRINCFYLLFLFVIISVFVQGCGGEEKVGPASIVGTATSINFMAASASGISAVVPSSGGGTIATLTITRGNATIVIEKAAFVIREMELERTENPDDKEDIERGPFVISLNLEGTMNTVALALIPPGSYDEIEFDIHKLGSDEIAAIDLSQKPEFSEFVKDNGYSIYVKGTFDDGTSGPIPFEFKSRINETQEHELKAPLEIKKDQDPVDINLMVNMDNWFIIGGQLVNPMDSTFKSTIEHNIKISIEHF